MDELLPPAEDSAPGAPPAGSPDDLGPPAAAMRPDDLAALLRSRRSVRRFLPRMPERALLESLIEAAVTAPSASNRQPWRFLVVTDPVRIGAMARAVRTCAARIEAHVPPAFQDRFREYGDYFTRFESAPAVIVPLCRTLETLSNLVGEAASPGDRERIAAMEADSGLISTSLALGNLLLFAHASGLGASCMTGPLIASDALCDVLDVSPPWKIVAVLPVGYPAEAPDPPGRKPAASAMRWLS